MIPFRWVIPPANRNVQASSCRLPAWGGEAAGVGRVGDDADPLARGPVARQGRGDVLGGDEDPVGQGDIAEAPGVEPVEGLEVEPAVAQVDREEVGRLGRLSLEDDPLLADVAVDHAQDRRHAERPAGRQGELGPDVAEDQRGLGPLPLDRVGDDLVEPHRPPPGDGVLAARPAAGQLVLGGEGGVEAPGRPDLVGRDPPVVPLPERPPDLRELARQELAGHLQRRAVAAVIESGDEPVERPRLRQADRRLIRRRPGVGAGD